MVRRAETFIDWGYPDLLFWSFVVPPVLDAVPVYWWVNDVLKHVGWLMPEAVSRCRDGHIFDLGDEARCDICGIPKSQVVNMERYRKEWDGRLNA